MYSLIIRGAAITLLLHGCISTYKPLAPGSRPFEQAISLKNITISWQYGVLREAGNLAYAENEPGAWLTPVSLLAFQIENLGTDTLRFPQGVIISAGGKLLRPLPAKKAFHLLKSQHDEETDNGAEEIYQGIMSLNDWASNRDFKKDLLAQYLYDEVLLPGEARRGLLAIRVKPGTPLQFDLKMGN